MDGDDEVVDQIALTSSLHLTNYLSEIPSYYRTQKFCDAEIICGDGASLLCHRIVLVALCPWLKEAASASEDQECVLMLPDCHSAELALLLSNVYSHSEFSFVSQEDLGILKDVSETLTATLSCMPWGADASLPGLGTLDTFFDVMQEGMKMDEDPIDVSQMPQDSGTTKAIPGEEASSETKGKEKSLSGGRPGRPKRKKRQRKRGCIYARRPKRCKKSTALVVPPESPGWPAVVQDLHDKFQSGGGERLKITMRRLTDYDAFLHNRSARQAFMACLGVRRSGAELEAAPLVWSTSHDQYESVIFGQYWSYCQALKEVLGFSDIEVHAQKRAAAKMGTDPKNRTRSSFLRRNYASYTSEKLREILACEELANATRTGQEKERLQDILEFQDEEELQVTLKTGIETACLEGIMFVWHDRNKLQGHFLQHCPRKTRTALVTGYVTVFFDILLLGSGKLHLDKCQKILDLFDKHQRLKAQYVVAKEFLEDDADGSKRRRLTADEQCPECGKVFEIKSQADKQKLLLHKKGHFYEDYKCDCEVTWTSFTGKKYHVQLQHMEGYEKCEHCSYVSSSNMLPRHFEMYHSEVTCEHCGRQIAGTEKLLAHVIRVHPEHRTEKMKGRKGPETEGGICDVCGMYFKLLEKHKKRHSQKPVPCPYCGKILTGQRTLHAHILNTHTPKEDLPYACEKCDRR